MNKPLLISLAAAALLSTNLNAQTMLERFEAMEKEMNSLKQQIAQLKSVAAEEDEEEVEETASDTSQSELPASIKEAADDEEGDEEGDGEEIVSDEERIDELEEAVSELTRNTSGSHLKFKVDYRFAIENINYKMADGTEVENDGFMTNRLWIDMGYKATNNLSFKGQLAYNKAFGQRSGASNPSQNAFEAFDWIANENAYDDSIRVRSVYFLYQDQEFMGMDIPWTFSIGRRPSAGGQLVNLREDDIATSPMGHTINVEFDGLSSKFTLNKEWGTSIKLCLGRGMSEAAPKFSSTPYADVDNKANPDIDIAGLIFTPYDDKQYKLSTLYYYANNLIDQHYDDNVNNQTGVAGADGFPDTPTNNFDTVGGLHTATAYLSINGIGREWSDFLDETTLFISGAVSITDPKEGQTMFGSADRETGTSYWIGAQFPSLLTQDGRWGVEYNHGSKYWRPITYGEDTNIGSKIAARGDAYEVYFNEYLVEDALSMQLRYTYIDYKYSGSNGFFGSTTGMPMTMSQAVAAGSGSQVVDEAQDIRLYIRYRF